MGTTQALYVVCYVHSTNPRMQCVLHCCSCAGFQQVVLEPVPHDLMGGGGMLLLLQRLTRTSCSCRCRCMHLVVIEA